MAFYPKLSFFCDGENLMEFIGVENGAISYIEATKWRQHTMLYIHFMEDNKIVCKLIWKSKMQWSDNGMMCR